MAPSPSLAEILALLAPLSDVLAGRVEDADPPAWCKLRGWTDFLLSLSEAELVSCETEGLPATLPQLAGVPRDLLELGEAVARVTRLPRLDEPSLGPDEGAFRSVRARKRLQLPALLGAVSSMAERASRIVDVGAGSGHFTRLSAELFDREALGLERNPDRVAAAEDRLFEEPLAAGAARFLMVDAFADGLSFEPGDLAVGLHACGALGDRLVSAAAEAKVDLALVSCCLGKIDAPARAPLSRAAAGFSVRREILGLTNLTQQPQGVEVSLAETQEARLARHALGDLLRARGLAIAPGEEARGINRRRARKGLRDLAERALELRGLPPPTDEELALHEREARRRYGVVRRLSLPRSALARVLEIAVVLDRQAALEEAGLHTVVATVFDRAVSPRNLGLFASRSSEGLPRVGRR